LDAVTVFVRLPRDLLRRRDGALGAAVLRPDVDHDDPPRIGTGIRLDDTTDYLSLPGDEIAVDLLRLGFTQALEDDLTSRGRGHPAKIRRGGVELSDAVALVVDLRGEDRDRTGLAVEFDTCHAMGSVGPLIGGEKGVLQGRHEIIQGDLTLLRQHVQRCHIDIHRSSPSRTPRPDASSSDNRSVSARGAGRNSTRMTARATSVNATESTTISRPDFDTSRTV